MSQSRNVHDAIRASLRLLRVRPRTTAELCARLRAQGFDGGVIEEAIVYLKQQRSLDDRAFARLWIEQRLQKPFGPVRIARELQKKEIAQEVFEPLLREYFPPGKEEALIRLLIKKKQVKSGCNRKKLLRLHQLLLRSGFRGEIVEDILGEYYDDK